MDTPALEPRIRWLFRVDGLAAPQGLVGALGALGGPSEVRRAYRAWCRSARLPRSSVDTVEDHLRGATDPLLRLGDTAGIVTDRLLGAHESVLWQAARLLSDGARHAPVDALGRLPPALVQLAQARLLAQARTPYDPADVWSPEALALLGQAAGGSLSRLPPEPPTRWVAFGAVDRLALVFGRAALGPALPPAEEWLPARFAPLAHGEPLRAALAPDLLPTSGADAEVAALAGAVAEEGGEGAAVPAVDRVCSAALDRWRTAFRSLCDLVAERAHPRPFRTLARSWLEAPHPGRAPRSRSASDGDGGTTFQLDPIGAPADCELVAITWAGTRRVLETGTWIVNEWPEARALVRFLAVGVDPQTRQRRGIVWVHHRLFVGAERDLAAFKKVVSVAGLVPWCLAELDAALERVRPRDVSSSRWREAAVDRVRALPKDPWPAGGTPDGAGRSLTFLDRVFR